MKREDTMNKLNDRVYIVTASISVLENIRKFSEYNDIANEKIIVVDEGDESIRKRNKEILRELNIVFYGPKERAEWFRSRFGESYSKYLSVIPERSHAETSFGFLAAAEDGAEIIIEIDDDVFPYKDQKLVKGHLDNLGDSTGVAMESTSKWINTIDLLELENSNTKIFPRGHPYDHSVRNYIHNISGYIDSGCVLNMGLWSGVPDLDAVTILANGGLDGRPKIRSIGLKRNMDKVIVKPGNYFAVCSMNTSFRVKILPAFYQLYMRYMNIDRFDDIWSGIFVKKIADLFGDHICIGKPILYHDKRPRPVWKDLKIELEGMIINEWLWKIVDEAELDKSSYADAYISLADHINRKSKELKNVEHEKFIKTQTEKMKLWIDVLDKLHLGI